MTDAPITPPGGNAGNGNGASGAPDPLPSTTPRRPGTIYNDGTYATSPTPTSKTTTTSAAYDDSAGRDQPSKGEFAPHRPLLITGSALLLGGYAASTVVATVSDLPADDRLYIPIVGPFLDVANRPCDIGSSSCSNEEDLNKASIIGLGLAQGAGLGLTIASFFVKERPAETRIKVPQAADKLSISVVPYGAGVGAVGRF
jgi:hypothetical protein